MVRDEKVKVLQAIPPSKEATLPKGAFEANTMAIERKKAYRRKARRRPLSRFACSSTIGDGREFPFIFGGGKAMSCRTTQIVIQFKEPPHVVFGEKGRFRPEANRLVIKFNPRKAFSCTSNRRSGRRNEATNERA